MSQRSKPHGQHVVNCLEDHNKPGMRIYEIRDAPGLGTGRLGFTGEELDWVGAWWAAERAREGVTSLD
ncbi:MAG: hypothetical protein ABIO65_11080 [Nitrospiria bacterium]